MQFGRSTTFLPLTTNAAARLARTAGSEQARRHALVLRHRAEEAETAAAQCWTALLAGCDTAGRGALGPTLRRLSEATSYYVGTRWWFAEGAGYRRRVAQAQQDIEDAIAEADGQEFASAFVGYDNAMASAVVCAARAQRESRSATP